MAQLVGGIPDQPRRLHRAGDDLFHPPVGDAVFPPPGDEHRLLFGRKPLHCPPLLQIAVQRLDAGLVQVNHPLLVSLAEQADLPARQVDVVQIHPHQLSQTHPAVEEQRHHAVVPLREISLIAADVQQFHRLVGSQVFGQDLVQLGWADRRGGVVFQAAGVVDHVVIKAVQAGKPPGRRGFFVAAGLVQKIQIFVDILSCDAAPESRIQPFGVDILHFCIRGRQAPPLLHELAEIAQVAIVIESRVGAFACDDFQIAHIVHNILGGILKGLVLARVLFVQINRHNRPRCSFARIQRQRLQSARAFFKKSTNRLRYSPATTLSPQSSSSTSSTK